MKTFYAILLFFAVVNTSHANLLYQGFTLDYDVSYNTMSVGSNIRTLKFTDKTHATFTSTATPEGMAALILNEVVSEVSKLKITPEGVRPVHYDFKKTKQNKTEAYQILFNWDKKSFYSTHEKKNFVLPDNTQDISSFMLYIMYALQNRQYNFIMPVAYKNRLRKFEVEKTGRETLELEFKDYQTITVEHYDKDKNERYTFWCAPALDYLPVQIIKTDRKGNNVKFVLRELKR